jgi:flagellar motor component MotA
MRSIFGIIGFLALVVSGIIYGSPLWIFIDVPSLLFVLGSIMFLSTAKYSIKDLLSFSDQVVMSLINFSLIGGGVGFIVGIIQMLQKISDPSSIGPAMATCVLSILYSLVIAACLYGIKNGINTRRVGAVALVGSIATLIPLGLVIISFAKS